MIQCVLIVREQLRFREKRHISRASFPFAQKIWYQHIWAYLHAELQTQEVLSAVLQPMLYIIQNSSKEEYDQILFPTLKYVLWDGNKRETAQNRIDIFHLVLRSLPLSFSFSPLQASLHQPKVNSGNCDPSGKSARHPREDTHRIRARSTLDAVRVL